MRRSLALIAAGAIAACAPDIDYLLFPLDPPRFLAHWHRGPSHSLLLLPLWAWLLASLLGKLKPWRDRRAYLLTICLGGWLSHIALDLLNSYGTQVLSPFSNYRPALHWTFELDPLLTALLALLLFATLSRWWRAGVLFVTLLLGLYLGQLHRWHQQALSSAAQFRAAHQLKDAQLQAFPQPLISAHRHLVVQADSQYCDSYQRLSETWLPSWFAGTGDVAASLAHYHAPDQASWRCFAPFASTSASTAEIQARWADPRFHYFREFAVLPMLDSVISNGDRRCLWFSDLRYNWPVLPASFRYGFCREAGHADWQYYRLRYLRHDGQDARDAL